MRITVPVWWLIPIGVAGHFAPAALGPDGQQQQVFMPGREGDDVGVYQEQVRPLRKPKNIVFILTDDQDAVSDSVSFMPRLQKHVVNHGTHFENHFTTTAICCPSRVSLWTGRQPHNTNVTDVDPPYGKQASDDLARVSAKARGLTSDQICQGGFPNSLPRA